MSDVNASYPDSSEEPEQLTPLTSPAVEEAPAEEPLESEVVDELTAWQSSIDTRSSFVRHVAADYPTWLERTFGRRVTFYPYTGQRFGVFLDGQRIQWGRMNKRAGVSITLPLTKDGPAIERLKDLTPQSGFYVSPRGSQFTLQNDADYAIFQDAMRLIGGLGPVAVTYPYQPEDFKRLLARFKQRYAGFTHERYYNEERYYKEKIAERIRSLVGKERLGALIAAGDFDAAKAAIKQACGGSFRTPSGFRQPNNLLGRWDLQAIEAIDAEPLARTLYNLLYGDNDFSQRFQTWVDLLTQVKSNTWPLATYFLAMLHPDAHIFVRPTPFQIFSREIGDTSEWSTRPNLEKYTQFQQLAAALLEDLRPQGARDLIDVQSFIWVVQERTEAKAWIFQANPDNYDLPSALGELDELDWGTRQHADSIKIGDTVYLWEAGPNAGLLAVARVTTEPAVIPEGERELRFYRDPSRFKGSERRVQLRIERVLPKRLPRIVLQGDPELAGMAILRNAQGTNFALTDAEAARLDALTTPLPDPAAPDPLDGPAFVLIHRNYGPIYRFTRDAGGSPRRLAQALEEWQRSGKPVYAILYRPSPYKVFAAWAQVEQAEATDNGRTWTVTFEMHPFEPPVGVHRMVGAVSWLDPARNLAVAFRGISIRPIPSGDFHTVLAVAQASRPPEAHGESLQPEEPLEPMLFAAEGARFWRFNVAREYWGTAREHGLLGWEGVSASQSAQRLRHIRVGDRVVAYIPGGKIGGIGMVIRAYRADDPQAGSPAELFGGGHLQRIAVLWATSPSEPIHVLDEVKDDSYAYLFQRFKDPNPIDELTREQYADILSLLGVDDIEPPALLPATWPRLTDFIAFVRNLSNEVLDALSFDELVEGAQPAPAETGAENLAFELRQLRLIRGVSGYERLQTYVSEGDPEALMRLSALGLLVEDVQNPDSYLLPARAILPRLREAQSPRPVTDFAPELGAEGELLLRWYAEAGLAILTGDTWQVAPGALEPLPGDDPASVTYREVLEALLRELNGSGGTGLSHVRLDEALPPSPDLNARMAELGRELLIDSAVIRRIYRSLMAGRHVVLSGPPGTGKTELARLLPTLLWREEPQTLRRLTTDPDQPPIVSTREERHGYLPIVVTATEDWGVRDVVGGIGPRLDGTTGSLSYSIEHGALTRVVLQHFAGTHSGRRLPPPPMARDRRDPIDEDGRRYRGAWLVIDEFTRAPIDAAFGSLLTTLGGGKNARLTVPTPAGDQHELPLPRDFRIIGTLNSFDRHFLNQMSEAMKRRFDFIDVLPPGPEDAPYEQGLAALQAIDRLRGNGFAELGASGGWPGSLVINPARDARGLPRYVLGESRPEARDALDSFWRIFSAIRVFRQLGTAQVVAVYTNLFAGVLVSGMSWDEALDTALADALADQLQVLSRDEQRTIDAFIEHAEHLTVFGDAIRVILSELPPGRRAGYLYALKERAVALRSPVTIHVSEDDSPDDAQIGAVFAVGARLSLPASSTFRRRLRDLIGERGL